MDSTIPVPVGISLAAPLERVHTFRLKGPAGLAQLSRAIEVRAPDPDRFDADLTTVQLGAIGVDSLITTPFTGVRSPAKIRAVPLDVAYFGIVRLGRTTVRQGGRETVQLPGAAALLLSSTPFEAINQIAATGVQRSHTIHTGVPMYLLPGRADVIARLTAVALPRTPLLAAALNFLSTVSLGLPQPGSPAATFVEHAIVDLLLAVLAEQTAESLPAESTEAGTRLRIRDFVLRRLPDSELGPQRIASEFGISTRYLHRLFESEDTSVGSFIRRERLKKAAGDLADPALRHLDVKAIAARSGFAGADQFARAFKSVYGLTPRDFRRAGRP